MKPALNLENLLAIISVVPTVVAGFAVVNGHRIVFGVSFVLLLVCHVTRLWVMGQRKSSKSTSLIKG